MSAQPPQPSDFASHRATSQPGPAFPPLVDDAIVLTGPTASGKSDIAISLAEKIGGEILSLDSIAIYRDMDIGTAKPSVEARSRIPHHLIDMVDPNEEFSVACYLKQAHDIVREIRSRGRIAIFVGGTPMFLKAVLRGFDAGPPPDWEFRKSVEDDVAKHGVDALRRRLRQVDPLAAHRIAPADIRRMIRALEVVKHTGVPMSHHQIQFDQTREASSCNVYSIRWDRSQLHDRINRRVKQMFDDGLIAEIKGLVSKYGELSRTACQAVGYREILPLINDGNLKSANLKQVTEEVAAHTRQLARRQETWFRSFSEITPIDVTEPLDVENVANELAKKITP